MFIYGSRFYGWRLVYIIISIFAAVFEFQTTNQILRYIFSEAIIANVIVGLVFFAMLQAVIIWSVQLVCCESARLFKKWQQGSCASRVLSRH